VTLKDCQLKERVPDVSTQCCLCGGGNRRGQEEKRKEKKPINHVIEGIV
jgi:hypothetical protein